MMLCDFKNNNNNNNNKLNIIITSYQQSRMVVEGEAIDARSSFSLRKPYWKR